MLNVEILEGINPKDFFPNEPYVIYYAFSVGERHYFHFDDALNIPYERAIQALVYMKELDCNIDRAMLEAHTQAVDKLLTTTPFSMKEALKLQQLNNLLAERLKLPKETEAMFKFASIVYFDQHESCRKYEFKYGENKIRHWKKNVNVKDFFLSEPLKQLIPYLRNAGENFLTFSKMTDEVTAEHKDTISAILSTASRMTSQIK